MGGQVPEERRGGLISHGADFTRPREQHVQCHSSACPLASVVNPPSSAACLVWHLLSGVLRPARGDFLHTQREACGSELPELIQIRTQGCRKGNEETGGPLQAGVRCSWGCTLGCVLYPRSMGSEFSI